jgi:hypothetical protein
VRSVGRLDTDVAESEIRVRTADGQRSCQSDRLPPAGATVDSDEYVLEHVRYLGFQGG